MTTARASAWTISRMARHENGGSPAVSYSVGVAVWGAATCDQCTDVGAGARRTSGSIAPANDARSRRWALADLRHRIDGTRAQPLAARDLPVVRNDVDPGLSLVEEDLLSRGVLKDERLGVARAGPGRFLTQTVAEDRRGARSCKAHVMGIRAGGVDDLRNFPNLGVDDRDVRRRDRLVVHRVH